ncbi:hydrocephalus-inducing protein homolog [Ischnura elegans]|uniref:hydrocephalus-inducing protein homolog n=1 Tax=Ischnura elegans TaxID=197161 RepID=UPI001ED8AED8|nr:hydrocephalus-inducing protein homolog [Ischnura elegans]
MERKIAELDAAEAAKVVVKVEENIYNIIEPNTDTDSAEPPLDAMNEHNFTKENTTNDTAESLTLDENDKEIRDNRDSTGGSKKKRLSSFNHPQNETEELDSSDSSKKMLLSKEKRKREMAVNSKEFFYINVILSAVVDYANCITTVPQAITFGNVLVSESKKHSVALTNVGRVPLNFRWKFRSLVYLSLSRFNTQKYNYCRIAKLKKRKGMKHAAFISLRGRNSKEYYIMKNGCTLKPFHVIPSEGSLKETGDKTTCEIAFTPLTSGYYRAILCCRINKPCSNPVLSKTLLEGIGVRKKYYFNYAKPDGGSGRKSVLSSDKPISNVCSVNEAPDSDLETVELHIVGFGWTHYKTLHFHHMSRKRSVFNWKCVDEENLDKSLEWKCITPNGIARPKSVTQMEFSFTPLKLGVCESKWSFSLFHNQKKCLHKIFHFIGFSSEPAVYFTEHCIKIPKAIPGKSIFKNACLVNEEKETIRFKAYGHLTAIDNEWGTLRVKPRLGTLEPQHSTNIRLSFTPAKTGQACFHLKFNIQKRSSPLVLTVICDSYDIQAEVKFILPTLSILKQLSEDKPNDIRLGRVQEKTTISGTFELCNKGSDTFDYSWRYKMLLAKEIGLDIKITNIEGTVSPSSKVDCCLKVSLSHKSRIENYPLILKVMEGPTFHIYLSMVASSPLCRFSFLCHDFGLCLLTTPQPFSRGKEVVLIVTGFDKNPITLECNFNPLCYLTVGFKKTTILFNETVKIPIIFCPQDYVKYRAVIPFTINGRWKRSVIIKGQAVPLKLELVHARDLAIEFKAVKAGDIVSKIVPVTSKTLVPIVVHFGLSDETDCEENWNRMTILPNSAVTLSKGEVIDVIVTFSPVHRMRRFTDKVVAFVDDLPEEHPLFVCHATCEEVDIILNNPCVQFGRVPKGITVVSYVSLMNNGDIGKRYKWDRKGKLNKQFTISPKSGFLNANQRTNFRITFRPISETSYIICKICCEVRHYKKIYLDISGFGHELPSPTESLNFNAPLRECDSKLVTIKNSSDEQMELIPFFCGEDFVGANILLVEPSSESLYEICYYPKSMKASTEHHGKLYFHLPNGDNYSWNLIGTVKPPSPCSVVKREVKTGVLHSEILRVENCLSELQRYFIHSELLPGEDGEPPFSITGYSGINVEHNRESMREIDPKKSKDDASLEEEGRLESISESYIGGSGEPGGFIDVPANSETSYKVNFICFRECELSFKVFFVCKETAEYQYHELNFTVIENNPEVFKITTSVFKKSCRTLNVANPLSLTPLNFSFICDLDFISVPEPIQVPPNCKETVVFQVFPLLHGHNEGTLTVVSPEIGDVNYLLDVRVLRAPLDEYPLFEFSAPLGSSAEPSRPIVLQNHSKTDACFTCKVDSSEFFVDENTYVQATSEEILNVTYEPSEAGVTTAVLIAESKTAGSFGFRLCGTATSPKIKGPYKVVANAEGIDIVFKNVLKKGMNFSVSVTEPFNVNVSSAWIESKEEKAITVSLDLPDDEHPSQPITGSLIIMPMSKEIHISTRWEYYLLGVFV